MDLVLFKMQVLCNVSIRAKIRARRCINMKLAYTSTIVKHNIFAVAKPTLREYLQEIARIGYDGCEIATHRGQDGYPAYLKKRDREQLRRLAEDLNLEISAIGAYGGMLLTTEFAYLMDRDEKMYAISYMKHCIDLAVDLNSEVVEDLCGIKPEGMTEKQAWDTLSSAIGEVCDYAHENNVYLAIEHFGLVDRPEKFLQLVKKVKSKALKCVYDPSNMIKYMGKKKKEILEGVDLNSDYIVEVHLKGVTKDLQFVRPCSSLDYFGQEEFLTALKRIGYDRTIAIEEYEQLYTPSTNLEPFKAARIAYEDVNKVLKKLNYPRQK